MKEKNNYNNDCIHLKACRRIQKIAEKKYPELYVPRYCNSSCEAYETAESFIECRAEKNGYYSIYQIQRAIDHNKCKSAQDVAHFILFDW